MEKPQDVQETGPGFNVSSHSKPATRLEINLRYKKDIGPRYTTNSSPSDKKDKRSKTSPKTNPKLSPKVSPPEKQNVDTSGYETDLDASGTFSTPDKNTRAKKRRDRTEYSPSALHKLENIFRIEKYPDINTREKLACDLGVTEDRIQVWFQNRRSKQRKRSPWEFSSPSGLPGVQSSPHNPFLAGSNSPFLSSPNSTLLSNPQNHQNFLFHSNPVLPTVINSGNNYFYNFTPPSLGASHTFPLTPYPSVLRSGNSLRIDSGLSTEKGNYVGKPFENHLGNLSKTFGCSLGKNTAKSLVNPLENNPVQRNATHSGLNASYPSHLGFFNSLHTETNPFKLPDLNTAHKMDNQKTGNSNHGNKRKYQEVEQDNHEMRKHKKTLDTTKESQDVIDVEADTDNEDTETDNQEMEPSNQEGNAGNDFQPRRPWESP